MARYTVNGTFAPQVVPALMPVMRVTPVSTTWGWTRINGFPGTKPIHAPKPGVLNIGAATSTQGSQQAPDMILPSLYYSGPPPSGWRHVPYRPQDVMPVPATNLYNQPGVAMRSRRTGGRHQVAQPAVYQQWPDILGRFGIKRFTSNGSNGKGA